MKTLCTITCLLLLVSNTSAQQKDTSVVLTVSGDVQFPLQLTISDLQKLPHRVVRAKDHDNKEYNYEGIELYRILQQAGIKFADSLKGRTYASSILVVRASDSYRSVFSLIELDPTFSDKIVILANQKDKKPLPANIGLLQVIVPDERRHVRWVRQVQSFVVQQVK